MQNVTEIKLVKNGPRTDRMRDLELRIGNVDKSSSAQVHFSNDNPLVGTMGAHNTNMEEVFPISPPSNGRYLTIQSVGSEYLCIEEVYATQILV